MTLRSLWLQPLGAANSSIAIGCISDLKTRIDTKWKAMSLGTAWPCRLYYALCLLQCFTLSYVQ